MAWRTSPPFRADHVGSLLRPPELISLREAVAAGRSSREELRAAEDRAVRDAVALQKDVGLPVVTDGELRRGAWQTDFVDRLGGVARGGPTGNVAHDRDGAAVEYRTHRLEIVGKLSLPEVIFASDFRFLQSVAPPATPKLTIPSPSMLHTMRAAPDPAIYPDQFLEDVASVYAAQVRGVAELGCRYLQLDDTVFAFLNDPAWRERVGANIGRNLDRQHETNIEVINRALVGRPAQLTVVVHMCRGNFRSAWFSSGGYDHVAEEVFSCLEVDGFFLEYDDERSGSFEPLQFVPPDKVVVLGLVTTKVAELESKDDLKRRIEAASKFVPLEQLCLSPQCGFASTIEGNRLSAEEQWAKLRLVVETAEEVWGRAR
jgi:5-methyltetrahydropteroyltriglutamate--homocysteine methyltransferase